MRLPRSVAITAAAVLTPSFAHSPHSRLDPYIILPRLSVNTATSTSSYVIICVIGSCWRHPCGGDVADKSFPSLSRNGYIIILVVVASDWYPLLFGQSNAVFLTPTCTQEQYNCVWRDGRLSHYTAWIVPAHSIMYIRLPGRL